MAEETKDFISKEIPQRTACEVYSRVVGYIRPVGQWNPGKQSEFYDRVMFDSPQ